MKKKMVVPLAFLVFVLFVYILSHYFANNPKYSIEEIRSGFKGKLIRTYFLKVDHYVFYYNDQENDKTSLSDDLIKVLEVGDSIIKIPDDNRCKVIKPNGKIVETYYRYISDGERNDYRFPKEWKNKPEEWYGK